MNSGKEKDNSQDKDLITLSEAKKEVKKVTKRLALLHLTYARTIINELGEEEGEKLIKKSIKNYGKKIGEKTREEVKEKDLELKPENFGEGESLRIPKFGMNKKFEKMDKKGRAVKIQDCVLAELWDEYDETELGRLYCYVDPAKYMAYNNDYKQIHKKCKANGDKHCELIIKPTKKTDKNLFKKENKEWTKIDK